MQPTTLAPRQEAFVAEMAQRMAEVARHLSLWASEAGRTLGELEQHAVRLGKELGNALLAGGATSRRRPSRRGRSRVPAGRSRPTGAGGAPRC